MFVKLNVHYRISSAQKSVNADVAIMKVWYWAGGTVTAE